MPPHAFAKTSPVPGGTSLSRHSPLIFMKCLRHLLALLRSPGLCRVSVLLRGGHRDLHFVPSPYCPWEICTSRLSAHFSRWAPTWPESVLLGCTVWWCVGWNLGPEVAPNHSLQKTIARPQAPIAFSGAGQNSGPCLFVCLFVYVTWQFLTELQSCSAPLVTVTQRVFLTGDSLSWLGWVWWGVPIIPALGA